MIIRSFFIRFVTPHIWRQSPRRKIAALYEFASTEKDSGCQILASLPAFKDPRDRASLLHHVLEEFHHSDMFSNLAKTISSEHVESQFLNRKNILPPNASREDLLEFLAYAHVGEIKINNQFALYNKGDYDPKIKSVFNRIAMDESEHGDSMVDLFYKIGGNKSLRLRYLLLKARVLHFKSQMDVYFSNVADFLLKTLLGAVYFLIGGLTSFSVRKRLESMSQEELLELLREEKKSIGI